MQTDLEHYVARIEVIEVWATLRLCSSGPKKLSELRAQITLSSFKESLRYNHPY